MLTFGSLFAGIGGFDLGLERAGMVCKWQVESNDYASRVLAKHWPHVERWGDVRTFPPSATNEWCVDLICAGVPCQPVSHAGKQKGADDERWMWGEALRVVADIQPRFFVAENPIGILSHGGGGTFRGLLRALASVGYLCEWHVIAAADVGAPHRRQRVWLVCFRDRHGSQANAPRADANGVGLHRAGIDIHGGSELRDEQERFVGSLGSDVADADRGRLPRERLTEHAYEQGSCWHQSDTCGSWGRRARQAFADSEHRGCQGRDSQGQGSGAALSSSWWLAEPDVGRVAHGVPARVDRLRCLGNAVVPQVVEVIGRAIIAHEERNRTANGMTP
jgi:DNA (cytosine-5)-methyltransferase 1